MARHGSVGSSQRVICGNCDRPVAERYCAFCGQRTSTTRLDLEAFLEEMAEVGLHVSTRLLFTLRELVFRPSETIDSYLKGKRKTYQNPVGYFAVGYLVLYLFVHYVLAPTALPVGTLPKFDRERLFLGMLGVSVVSHFIVVHPRLRLLETIVIFVFLYGTLFFLAIGVYTLEVFLQGPVRLIPSNLSYLAVDAPLLAILVVNCYRATRFIEVSKWRFALAVSFGLAYFYVMREVFGFR